jgi:hypothetical protein
VAVCTSSAGGVTLRMRSVEDLSRILFCHFKLRAASFQASSPIALTLISSCVVGVWGGGCHQHGMAGEAKKDSSRARPQHSVLMQHRPRPQR